MGVDGCEGREGREGGEGQWKGEGEGVRDRTREAHRVEPGACAPGVSHPLTSPPTHACNPTHTPPNMCMCNGASLKPETEADPSLSVGAAALAVKTDFSPHCRYQPLTGYTAPAG